MRPTTARAVSTAIKHVPQLRQPFTENGLKVVVPVASGVLLWHNVVFMDE